MLFIPENDLEKALVRAVKEPATAPLFYRLLLASDLLVLGTVEGQEDATRAFSLAPGGKISLVPGTTKDGVQYLPVFSSLARMQDYVKQESKYLSVNGRALLDLTRGAPVILNPASEYGKELAPDQVRQLLDGLGSSHTIAGEAAYPMALVEMLAGLFATRPEVEIAWMIQVVEAANPEQPHPLVGIETASPAQWPSLMQAIEAAAQANHPGLAFDVQRIDRFNPGGMTGALLQAEPFYRRNTLN
jgi:hypothetical protein